MNENIHLILNKHNFIHEVFKFIKNNNINISNYEDTKEVYTKMVENGYFFMVELEIQIKGLHELTYFLNSSVNNKNILKEMLTIDESDSEEEEQEVY